MTLFRSFSQTIHQLRSSVIYSHQRLFETCRSVQSNLKLVNYSNHFSRCNNAIGSSNVRFVVGKSWCPVKEYVNHIKLISSSNLKERIYDKLILFTQILRKQSNVYLSLQLRKCGQTFSLYYRLYSPNEFKNIFLNNILHKIKNQNSYLSQHLSNIRKCANSARYLLGFATCGVFAWDEQRITDEELNELIKEFVLIEKRATDNYMEKCNENIRVNYNCEKESEEPSNFINDGSFMVVNCLQSTEQVTEKWEEVLNQPNFHVWRKSVSNSSLYQYKVYGSYTDISAYSFYSVIHDLDYRKEWDKLVLKLEVVDTEPDNAIPNINSNIKDSGNELIHWVMKYPYPMKNREYVYLRRSRIDHQNKFIILLSRAVQYSNIVETEDNVRVYDYVSQMVIKPHNGNFYDNGFDYMLTYFDDPRASFPSPAYNWMASRGLPEFVENLHQAALKLFMLKQNQENVLISHKSNLSNSSNDIQYTNTETGTQSGSVQKSTDTVETNRKLSKHDNNENEENKSKQSILRLKSIQL